MVSRPASVQATRWRLCAGMSEVIAGAERARLGFAVEQHAGRTREHRHPFVPVLVVPEAVRTRVPARDDALDADIGRGGEFFDLFLREVLRDVGEQVGGGH